MTTRSGDASGVYTTDGASWVCVRRTGRDKGPVDKVRRPLLVVAGGGLRDAARIADTGTNERAKGDGIAAIPTAVAERDSEPASRVGYALRGHGRV